MADAVLATSPFLGEGHRKVWAMARHSGHRVSMSTTARITRV